MKKLILILLVALLGRSAVNAQMESVVHQGEIGIAMGAAHYFGDLNTKARVNRPKLAVGVFFRKQFGNYIAVRVGGQFAQIGYSDKYYDDNDFQHTRNLSFNSSIWELSLLGDFNFFKFVPGTEDRFTPYVTLGASIFSYDPYAYLHGQKQFLRPLGTEGQGSAAYPDRKTYGSMAFAIPFGVGVKYALNSNINVGFELLHRFTNTDYLDDVSTTYVGIDKFPPMPDGTPSVAAQLQDRSTELGDPIGIEGRQRGYAKQKDQFMTAQFTVSFNLSSYRCPTAKY
jgi:opacity protein-like surface antigen